MLKEHHDMVRRILRELHENKLYFKPEKCIFEALKVEFLGLIVGNGHVKMDPNKVKAVTNWLTPKCKRDIQQFLGFLNFYQQFIRDFGKIAKPLMKLTGKNDWEWTDDQQQAFEDLKSKITSTPVLVIPNDRD
ncbi:hypothetical protein Moror_545 [Moniliophthora roreri MCA 2997]|uniref:Reverse transcriptase-rnase h-integrase n=1 Tax=Moniliophthora roreri (strain MCA 2997) TaxID=1381753 RepID=V2WDA4_MONRO|nr:hypothetical protein Moror_545 [Moniliophthora roreri MCA 2997]